MSQPDLKHLGSILDDDQALSGLQTMTMNDNPCAACSLERNCCQNLEGLKVSRAEYERNFQHHGAKLDVYDHGEWLELYSVGDAPCPNWDVQCQVYESRPVECALYPHTISEVEKRGETVTVAFHNRTACPLNAELSASDEDAAAMVRAFAEDTFGPSADITVCNEKGAGLLSALPMKLRRKLAEKTNTHGKQLKSA